jgi:hypothetical protein
MMILYSSYFLITLVERGLENRFLMYDSITSLEVSTQFWM